MSKLTKNQKSVADKVEAGKAYSLEEAAALVKEITTTKFDASLDIDVRLGVDPRKANQMVRGVVSLPNGTGKVTRVLCLVLLIRRLQPKRLAPTMLVSTSISRRSKVAGQILMLSSRCPHAWVNLVPSVVSSAPAD